MQKKNAPRSKKIELPVGEEPRRSLESVRDALDAIRDDELLRLNVDRMKAVAIVLAAEPRARVVIEPVIDELPDFDAVAIRMLRPSALAMLHVETALSPESADVEVKEMVAGAQAIRRDFLLQADGLAHRNLMPAELLVDVREGRGLLDLSHDVLKLVAGFRTAWPKIEGKTPITPDDLDKAETHGMKLVAALGVREGGVVAAVDADTYADLRARAFTLLAKRYDEVRRAVTYLRWHDGDADEIAPSLYAGSRGTGRRANGASNGTGDLPPPGEVAPAPVGDAPDADGDDVDA